MHLNLPKNAIFEKLDFVRLKIIQFFLALLAAFVGYPIFFTFCSIFLVYRLFVKQLAKIFKRDKFDKILCTTSTLFAVEELFEECKGTIVGAGIVEGSPSREIVLQGIDQALKLKDPKTGEIFYKEMKQTLRHWMGYPFFAYLDNFKLEDYVNYLEGWEDKVMEQEQLEVILKDLSFKPFRKDRSLWEIFIIPHYKPKPAPYVIEGQNYSVNIFRVHHCLTDSYSIFRLLKQINVGEELEFIKTKTYTKKDKIDSRPFLGKIYKSFPLLLRIPWDAAGNAMTMSDMLKIWPENPETDKLRKSPDYNLTRESLVKTFVTSVSPAFAYKERINEIKALHGVSGMAVIVAGIAAAVRNSMFPDASTDCTGIPENIGMSFPLPIPQRSEKLRNFITGGQLKLPLREPDSVKRLKLIDERYARMTKSTAPLINIICFMFLGVLPYGVLRFMGKVMAASESVFLTNVAAPRKGFNVCGYPVRDLLFSSGLPVRSKSICAAFLSYSNQARFGFAGDITVMRTPEAAGKFVENFLNEWDILSNSTAKALQFDSTNL